jgi:2'-phosphotransferase
MRCYRLQYDTFMRKTQMTSNEDTVQQHEPKRMSNNKRRRGGKSNHHAANIDPDVLTSKALSWALRHAAPELGLDMGPDGYVPLAQLLSHSHRKLRGKLTHDSVLRVVAANDKQRFSLIVRNDNETFIRANQGHSISTIDPYQLLTPIDPSTLSTIVHGTYMDPWLEHIRTEGLSKMSRTHIHFAKGMPNDEGVVSGMRQNCNVYIFVDGAKCADDRIEFWESANGVLLTAGVDGVLPPMYFSHVVARSGDVLLDQRRATTPTTGPIQEESKITLAGPS